MKIRAALPAVLSFGALLALLACSDPPPPSLGHVGIQQVYDNSGNTSITFGYADLANCRGYEGSVSKGITIGDGVTVAMSFSRVINDPPDDDKQAQALLDKPFTFAVTGDSFKIAKAKEADRVIITTIKPGEGTLVISVDGAGGNVAMPVRITPQSEVPDNVTSETSSCVPVKPDAGTSTTEAGADAGP